MPFGFHFSRKPSGSSSSKESKAPSSISKSSTNTSLQSTFTTSSSIMPSATATQIQHAAVQEPTKSTTDRETGFPEPLSPDRNTTLPHPSADTSPNATIIAPSEASQHRRTTSRSRSFLNRKHSHQHKASKSGEIKNIENGTVTALPQVGSEKELYDGIVYADGSREDGNGTSLSGSGSGSGGEEKGKVESGGDSGDEGRDEHGYRDGDRKKGVLRKLKLHKV